MEAKSNKEILHPPEWTKQAKNMHGTQTKVGNQQGKYRQPRYLGYGVRFKSNRLYSKELLKESGACEN